MVGQGALSLALAIAMALRRVIAKARAAVLDHGANVLPPVGAGLAVALTHVVGPADLLVVLLLAYFNTNLA